MCGQRDQRRSGGAISALAHSQQPLILDDDNFIQGDKSDFKAGEKSIGQLISVDISNKLANWALDDVNIDPGFGSDFGE